MTNDSESGGQVSLPLVLLFVALAAVVLAMPAPAGMEPAAQRLLAVAVLMAGLWMTQAVSLAATSLIPLALFPLLGIMDAKVTAKSFVADALFLYLGGMIIALGVERWNLHRRMALHVLRVVGISPRRMVAGFALASFGLSMWISNTATTMLMLPIALALLQVMSESEAGTAADRSGLSDKVGVPLLLVLAYGSSLGGMATLVGSPTNAVAVGIYREQVPNAPDLVFSQWLLACGPVALIYLGLMVLLMTWSLPKASAADQTIRNELATRLQTLGRMSVAEKRMLLIFGVTALLWVFREPLEIGSRQLLPGWQQLYARGISWVFADQELLAALEAKKAVSDSTVAVLMAILMFTIPSGTRTQTGRMIPLMDWQTANRLPWDMILLFGGGFALAAGFETTGLSVWLAGQLQEVLADQPAVLVVAAVCAFLVTLTELTSNVATVSAILPALLVLAQPLGMDPRMLLVPAALATSASFMLPVGTPPNAIVFGSGRIPAAQMARHGFLLNLIGVPLLTGATWLIIRPVLGIP